MATIQLPPDFKEFLQLLNSEKIEYLVIGGYAVGHYGYVRATAGMDVWISTSPQNADKVAEALVKFGFERTNVAPSMFTEREKVFRMGFPPTRIELLTSISGVDFATCYARRAIADWGGTAVSLIGLADLKANKKASGRPKDMSDLAGLG